LADQENCHLIPEEERSFVVPRASKAGKGKGMGQSTVWYADSAYAQEEFVPEVLAYLDSVREKCAPLDIAYESIFKKAEDHGESAEELVEKGENIMQEETVSWKDAFGCANLAIEKEDCYQTRFFRGKLFQLLAWYDEAEEDYRQAMQHEETVPLLSKLMYVEVMLNRTHLGIELGEKIWKRKDEDERWPDDANNLVFFYIEKKEFDKARKLINECRKENNPAHTWIETAKACLEEREWLS
jgi:tetratricopeptide (TPR) repeat protein